MEIANVVIGYKCFKKGLINQSGISFEEGKTYSKNEQANNGTQSTPMSRTPSPPVSIQTADAR